VDAPKVMVGMQGTGLAGSTADETCSPAAPSSPFVPQAVQTNMLSSL